VSGSQVLVLGLAFKENCPDLRNSRVIDIINELQSYSVQVDVYDPWVAAADALHEYGIERVQQQPEQGRYDAVIIAVGHDEFREQGEQWLRALCKPDGVLYDVKYLLPATAVDGRL